MLVLLLDSRAGVPPSGLTLLESHAERHIVSQLGPLFAQYELWVAEVLDSHLSYPILPFFRSSHAGESWISALGAVLDASVLLTTAVEAPPADARDEQRACRAAAEMFYHLGCHALVDLTNFPGIRRMSPFNSDPGIERAELTKPVSGCTRGVTRCGLAKRPGRNSSSNDRSMLRGSTRLRGFWPARQRCGSATVRS